MKRPYFDTLNQRKLSVEMRILIFGNGLIGSSLIENFLQEGHDLHVYSRGPQNDFRFVYTEADIFDSTKVLEALAWNPQVIVHTTWITTPGLYKNDQSNFLYAESLISLARKVCSTQLQHLIVLGTCAEYGSQVEPIKAGSTTLNPSSFYSQQKVRAFRVVQELMSSSGTRFTWARIFYPYGPNQDKRRLIPMLIHSLSKNVPIVLDDVSSVYDWISSRDIASAISWVISHELPTELDIATSVGYTNLQVLQALEKILNIQSGYPDYSIEHKYGLEENYVASKNSPIFKSGWMAQDSLFSGLDWTVKNCLH